MYGRELFNPFKNNTNLYGHITITKDFFTLKIPEQQISVTDTIDDWNIPDGIVHTIYKISEITISGNCKWSELHGKKRADYDGSLNVKPSSFKYENIQTYKGRKGERLVNVQHNYILIHRVAQKQEPSTWDNNPLIFDDYNHHNRIIICVLCSKVESTTSSKEGEQVKDSHGSESDVVVSIQLELIDEIDAPEETPTYEEDNEASDEGGIGGENVERIRSSRRMMILSQNPKRKKRKTRKMMSLISCRCRCTKILATRYLLVIKVSR